jgi:hypothetical protein
MTKHPDLFAALAAPFEPAEVKVFSKNGKQIHYTTARTIMNRLDQVLGPENWWDDYTPGEHSVLCRLSIRLPDGSVLTKADAGGYAGMADEGDDDKSGYSDAFKRAAVKFGVARYLYRDGVPSFVAERTPAGAPSQARPSATTPAPADLGWVHRAPEIPVPANGNGHSRTGTPTATATATATAERPQGLPRTGKALFAWVKDQEQRFEVGLLKYLNQWGKLQDWPGRMVDWDAEMVGLAVAEAQRKLSRASRGEAETN